MRSSTILSFGLSLVSLATATTSDGPAIKALLATLGTNMGTIEKSIGAVTEANIAEQVPTILKNIETLDTAIFDSAKQIKGTKALGILDLTSLASAIPPIQKSAQSLLTAVVGKRNIMVKANQVDALAGGLKKMEAGLLALNTALVTQLPPNLAASIPKGISNIEGANIDQAKLQDTLFEVGLAVFKGKDAQVAVSGSIWPLEKAAAKREIAFKA
ncbi:hypothetical protein BLS_006436 [Venturia inaequalis]|uniref:Cell wall protein n=1 Tax=Venturia inaequalis TaxID=5025 RepID=A0A8H3UEP9_VENIN|nr:hypothetical protein BLS_006436 [Venturia inaequalis]